MLIIPHVNMHSATSANGRAMPAEATTKKKETFVDWEHPDGHEPAEHWISREDMLAILAREGIAIDRDDIRTWQLAGIIPYGVSKWHAGRKRTFYARWMTGLLRTLRTQQQEGRSMKEIAADLRVMFRGPGRRVRTGQQAVIEVPAATAAASALVPEIVPAPPGLQPQLAQFARTAEVATGTRIVTAEVRLIDERGRPLVFAFPTPEQNAVS